MVGWKTSPHIDVQLRFDAERQSKQARSPAFNGDDQISGVATFNLKKNYEDIRYRVVVKGTSTAIPQIWIVANAIPTGIVETKTQEHPPGGLNSASHVETHTFLSAVMFDGSANPSSTPESKYRTQIPFKLALQNEANSVGAWGDSRINGEIVQEVLPTINSKAAPKHWADSFKPSFNADFRITYTVIASAFHERKMVASTSRDFSFLPTSSPPPPVPVEDFADEYALRASKALQKGGHASRIGLISEEPPALPLKIGAKGGSTNINIFVMLFRPHTRDFDANELPKQLRIRAKLRSTTFVMPKRSKLNMHTLQGAMYDREASVKQDKSHVQNYTMAIDQWQTNESESEGTFPINLGKICNVD